MSNLLLPLTVLVALHARAPFLISSQLTTGKDLDGVEHVTGLEMVIENPLRKAVEITIHCGGLAEYDESYVRIDPRTRLTIEVETEPQSDFCAMTDWHIVK